MRKTWIIAWILSILCGTSYGQVPEHTHSTAATHANAPFKSRSDWFILPQISLLSYDHQLSYGLMVGLCKRHGAYASYRTNFDLSESNGPFSPAPLYTGKTKYQTNNINAGYLFNAYKPLYVYAGIGVDVQNYSWQYVYQNSRYDWELQKEATHASLEAGAIYRWKLLILSIGYRRVLSSFMLSRNEITFGAGVAF